MRIVCLNGVVRVCCKQLIPLAFASAVACGDVGFVAEVSGRRPFDPPPVYLEWWSATQSCSGQSGSFERIVWYLASGITGDGVIARARWSAPHEIIIVAGYENDEQVVRHEMLHDLLDGDRLHTREEWDRCGLRFEDGRIAQLTFRATNP